MNYHFHDEASSDGAAPLMEHCRAAAAAGVRELCVTNHVEVMQDDGSWTVELEEAVPRFLGEMAAAEAARERWPELRLRVGAEFEYRPEWTGVLEELAAEVPFDFVIGSVHVVQGLNVSGGREPEAFFSTRDRAAAYRAYFEAVREMVGWGCFDAVGHFDLVKRYGHEWYGPYDPAGFRDVIRETLEAMAAAGLGIEANGSGLHQPPGAPYPGPTVLAWAREAGVPFLTLGSDSHTPAGFARDLAGARDAALEAGWTAATPFRRREREGAVALEAIRLPDDAGPPADDRCRAGGTGGDAGERAEEP